MYTNVYEEEDRSLCFLHSIPSFASWLSVCSISSKMPTVVEVVGAKKKSFEDSTHFWGGV